MVLAKQEKQETPQKVQDAVLGATVYTGARQVVGVIFEVCEHCVGIALWGGLNIWLGKPMITSIEAGGVVLASNLLRKHNSVHMGIHVHQATKPAGTLEGLRTYAVSQAT